MLIMFFKRFFFEKKAFLSFDFQVSKILILICSVLFTRNKEKKKKEKIRYQWSKVIKITLFFGLPIDLILMVILFIYRSIKNLFKVFCFLAISTLFGYCLSDQIRIRFGGQKKQLFCPYWWWSIKWLKQQVKKKKDQKIFFVVIEDLYCLKLSAIYTQLSSTTRKTISRNKQRL